MGDCPNADVRDVLPDFVNGQLSGHVLEAVQAHLAGCEACRSEVALLEQARAAVLFATPRVDIARIVQSLPVASRQSPRWGLDWRIAAAIAVITVGGGATAVRYSARTAASGTLAGVETTAVVAVGPETTVTGAVGGPELSVTGGLGDLTEAQLRALANTVEHIESLPAPETRRVSVPLGGVLDPQGDPR